jgi:hypothetical protein
MLDVGAAATGTGASSLVDEQAASNAAATNTVPNLIVVATRIIPLSPSPRDADSTNLQGTDYNFALMRYRHASVASSTPKYFMP